MSMGSADVVTCAGTTLWTAWRGSSWWVRIPGWAGGRREIEATTRLSRVSGGHEVGGVLR